MTNSNKKSIIALIVAVLAVVAVVCTVAFASQPASPDQIGTGELGVFPNVNIVNTTAYVNGNVPSGYNSTTGFAVTDQNSLINFLSGSAGQNQGYLANDIILDWGGSSSTIKKVPKDIVLDGNGKKITIRNINNFDRGDSADFKWNDATDQNFMKNSYSYEDITKMGGGLARMNTGTIKNINFVWDTKINQPDFVDSYWATSEGAIFGTNTGTIENCSLVIKNDIGMKTYSNNKSGKESKYSTVCFGGYAGTLTNGGKIVNCSIDLQGSIVYNHKGIKYAENLAWAKGTFNKLFVGGMAGVVSIGGQIINATTKGSGNIEIYSSSADSLWNNAIAASGIIAGSNAKADDGKTSSEGNWTSVSIGAPGLINGVLNYWTGYARSNTSLGAEFPTVDDNHNITSPSGSNDSGIRGAICGLAGDWNTESQVKDYIYNVYYVNMYAPKALAAKNWTKEENKSKGNEIVTNDFGQGGTFEISFKSQNGGAPDVNANPKVEYTNPGADNQVVWNVTVNQNNQIKVNEDQYPKVQSVSNVSKFRTWNSDDIIERATSTSDQKYKIDITNGYVLAAGTPNGLAATPGTQIYESITIKEFDGNGIQVPQIYLYKSWDMKSTELIAKHADINIWKVYDSKNRPVSLDQANYVDDWTLRILDSELGNNISFVGKISQGNFVVFHEEGMTPQGISITQKIVPKKITAEWAQLPADFVYNGQEANFGVNLNGLVQGFETTADIKYYQLTQGDEDSKMEVLDNQAINVLDPTMTYRVIVNSLNSANYELTGVLSADFKINPREITVETSPIEFKYNGLEQKPVVTFFNADGAPMAEGDPNAPIKVKNLLDDNIVAVNYITTAIDGTFKNAGEYFVELELASGLKSKNYSFEKQKIGYNIAKFDLVLTLDTNQNIVEEIIDGVLTQIVVREYEAGYVTPKIVTNKPTNGIEPVIKQMFSTDGVKEFPFVTNIGNYKVRAFLDERDANKNYNLTAELNGHLRISPAVLTVEWDESLQSTIAYDGMEHSYADANGKGWKGTDWKNTYGYFDFSYRYTKDGEVYVGEPRDAGTYKVEVYMANPKSENYTFDGTTNFMEFTITPIEINIKAKDVTKKYGAINPTLEWEYLPQSPMIFADDESQVSISLGTTVDANTVPGKYEVTLEEMSGDRAGNYTVKFEASPEAFTVEKRLVGIHSSVEGLNPETNSVVYTGKPVTFTQSEMVFGDDFTLTGEDFKYTSTYKYTIQRDESVDKSSIKNVGKYLIEYAVDPSCADKYEVDTIHSFVEFAIDPIEVHATVEDMTISYGDDPYAQQVKYTITSGAFIEEDKIVVTASFTDSQNKPYMQYGNVGTYTMFANISSELGIEILNNYNFVNDVEVNTLTVNKRNIVVESIKLPDNLVYDGTGKLATAVVRAGDIVNNDVVEFTYEYKLNNEVVSNTINAGDYVVTISFDNLNYNLLADQSEMSKPMRVEKRKVVLTIDNVNVVYGDDVPTEFVIKASEGSLDFIGSDNVQIKATTEYTVTSPVGEYAISATTDANLDNYEVTIPTTAKVVVAQKEIVVAISLPSNLVYDATAKIATATFSGAINDDVVNAIIKYNGSDEAIDAGEYTITVESDNSNYKVQPITAGNTFAITPATLNFSIEDGEKGYGAAKVIFKGDSLGYTYEGEIYARDVDDVVITVASDAIPTEVIGTTYQNVLGVALSGNAAKNYSANVIKKGAVTIIANKLSDIALKSASNVYDGTNHNDSNKLAIVNAKLEDFNITYSGNGVTDASFDGADIKNVSEYIIKLTLKDEAKANYDTTAGDLVTLTYNITKRQVVIVASDKINVAYGDPKPADNDMWTYADGSLQFVENDNVVVTVNNLYTNTSKVTDDINVTYSTNASENYEVVLPQDTKMNIAKRLITAEYAQPDAPIFDTNAKIIGITLNGLVNGDQAPSMTITYNGEKEAINAGEYEVVVAFDQASDYELANPTTTMTIIPRELSVDKFILPTNLVYDKTAKTVTVTFLNLPDGITEVGYNVIYNSNDSETEAINAGSYEVVVSVTDPNYNLIGNASATLVIGKANQTLTSDNINILANFNKLTVNGGKANMEYKLAGGEWQKSNVFASGIKAQTSYTVVVKLAGDDNHNESNEVTLATVKTGVDPTPINAKLDTIGSEFGFEDIAVMKEIEIMIDQIAEQDLAFIDNAKLTKARTDYNRFVNEVNTVVNEAQIVAGKAAGRSVGAATAAAVVASTSLLGIALAIAKKKMLF